MLFGQSESTVTVSVVNGEQVRCITENKVEVKVTPNPNRTLVLMKLFWDENSSPIEIKPGDSFQRTHTYPINLPDDYCEYDCPISNGICRRVTVVAEYTSGTPENNSMLLTFKMIPEPIFVGSVACINNDLVLENRTCPANDEDMVFKWEYIGGISADKDATFLFNEAGSTQIKMTATNVCGSKTFTRTIRVIEPAIPELKADSNIITENQDSFFVCTNGKTIIRLVGSESKDASRYNWTASSGINFIGSKNRDTVRIEVSDPGTYVLELEVDNVCNVPQKKEIYIKVFRNENLFLQPTQDTCLGLSYTPTPLLEGVKYEINGKTYSNSQFPIQLNSSSNPYIVKATLINPCNSLIKTDTFYVSSAQNPAISFPEKDTSICQTSGIISLKSDIPGGNWMIGTKNIGSNFNPSEYPIGDIIIDYQIGQGLCAGKTSRKISIIPGNALTLPPDLEVCEKDNPLELIGLPTGGIWSGPSVDEDFFNPSIGSGEYLLTYQYENQSNGCISESTAKIKVYEIPNLSFPDSLLICNSDNPLDINQLLTPQLNPSGGTLNWSGPGVFNDFINAQNAGGFGTISIFSEYYLLEGCSDLDTISVSIGPVPETKVIEDTSLCNNQGTFVLEGIPNGGEWIKPDGLVTNPVLNLSSIPVGNNTYIYITAKGSSCESRDSILINVIDSEGINAGADIYVCEDLAQINLPSVNGIWIGPELIGTQMVNLQNLSTGEYSYTLKDNSLPEACNTDEILLSINPLPIADFILPEIVCSGTSFEIKNNSIGAEKYNWNYGDGKIGNQKNPVISYTKPGNYTVILEAIKLDPNNGKAICFSNMEKDIKVIDPPGKIDFTPTSNGLCSPMTTDFINRSLGENLLFTWDFGNGQTSKDEAPIGIVYTAEGKDSNFLVNLVADNGCGTLQSEIEIEVLASPVAKFASEFRDFYCSGEEIHFGHRSFGAELTWIFGADHNYVGDDPPPQKFYTTPDKNDTVLIQLQAKNRCGLDTALQNIVIIPTDAKAAITIPKSNYCLGDTVELESLSRPFDGRSIWTLPDGSNVEGLILNWVTRDTGLQKISLKSLSCGEDSAQIQFSIFPLPSIDIQAPDISCPGETITIKTFTNGIQGETYLNDSLIGINNIFHFTIPDISQIQLKSSARNAEGCISVIEKTINLNAAPNYKLSNTDTICSREKFRLAAFSDQNLTCSWQLPGGIIAAGCEITPSLDSLGLRSGQLIVQNDIGCSDSTSFNMFVRETPIADFDITIIDNCYPGSLLLTNSSKGANGIEWILPNGTNNYSSLLLYNTEFYGKKDIKLIATRDQVCFDEKILSAEIFQLPEINLFLKEGCTKEEGYDLEVQSFPGSIIEIQGPTSGKGNFFTSLKKGTYWINVETINGCFQDTMIKIPEVREFQGEIKGSDSIKISLGEVINLEAKVNESEVTTKWTPNSNSDFNIQLRPLKSDNIKFEAISSRGCLIKDSVFVEVEIDRETGIFIPQAFTPNNDGVNDIFMVRSSNPGLEKINSFKIFGPAGDLIFELKEGIPNNELSGWNGIAAQTGVYVYLVELEFIDDVITLKKGDVTLIR